MTNTSRLADAKKALDATLANAELLRAIPFPPPRGAFVVGPGILVDDPREGLIAKFILWDSADSIGYRMPYRACLLPAAPDGKWTVDAIESQCASCFGMGVLEGESRLCDTCGAVGWGVREVLATTEETGAPRLAAMRPA